MYACMHENCMYPCKIRIKKGLTVVHNVEHKVSSISRQNVCMYACMHTYNVTMIRSGRNITRFVFCGKCMYVRVYVCMYACMRWLHNVEHKVSILVYGYYLVVNML